MDYTYVVVVEGTEEATPRMTLGPVVHPVVEVVEVLQHLPLVKAEQVRTARS